MGGAAGTEADVEFGEVESEGEAAAPPRDFRIREEHGVGGGSLKEKARANVEAIRTLKAIETEGREATESEKAALVRYAGWGALPNVFHPSPPDECRAIAAEVRELLDPEEFEAARGSTPNAHYTSPEVIRGIWDGMRRMGLGPGAQVLEPSMGVGHFFGLMPEEMLLGVARTGVELDRITARIARLLYPDATIFAQGFEDTALPDNYFDAVVGNIPFGNYGVYDRAYKNSGVTRAIHDYFLAKSVDKLRPGGVMALITSRYTMDKRDPAIRRYLADRANLVAAIRLPNTAFRGNAGTEVTADIVFLQKRQPGTAPGAETWEGLSELETEDGPVEVNEYFARHPEMLLGEMRLERGMYRSGEPTLAGELSVEALAGAIEALPEGIIASREPGETPAAVMAGEAVWALDGEVKDGAYAVRDNRLVIRRGSGFEVAKMAAATAWRVRAILDVRDAVRRVFRTQLEDAREEEIVAARRALNATYDTFVKRYGPLSARQNFRAFAGDPDLPLLLSLEEYDVASKRAAKTAIFERRTLERYRPVERVETAAEALAVSLNETGEIRWRRMEDLTGRRARSLQRELGSLVYRNPEGGGWETADRYLSGDVRRKLEVARAAAGLDASYERNVGALEAVQPEDIEPGDISARLGSSWIPAADVRDFIAELLDVPGEAVTVGHADVIATWTLKIAPYSRASVGNTTTWGTSRFLAQDLIEDALNGRVPTAYDKLPDDTRVVNQEETIAAREKQQEIRDRFREWVWQDPDRMVRLAKLYNEKFNNLRLREFTDCPLTFPGMNRSVLRSGELEPHQKAAVWRILQTPCTLLAHVVGAGKTWTMAAAAMELRRMGLAKKPMIVVPNHLVEQWGTAFLQLYPQANVLVAGREHFAKGRREEIMSRIATGNYDAVIVSHRSFEFLPVSDEVFERFAREQVAELEAAILETKADTGHDRRLVKELEKAKKRLLTKMKQRANRDAKDKTITFEELGVDQVFVDEADLYKNLGYVTKMNRIAGLPNSESNRAFDLYIKTRYLRERGGGRGVVFATGTPVANTMAEMYTMQRYLAPEMLKERGVAHFDAWAANFGEAVTALELAPDGSGYRMHTRFSRFVNLPELLAMFRSFADVQTGEMLDLPRPALAGGKPQVTAAPASDELEEYVKGLIERAAAVRNRGVAPSVDNMLKITGDGRKAALDMRLVDPLAEPDEDTKVGQAVEKIFRIWRESGDKRATQLVFCDLSTPKRDRFNVYEEARALLIERGVPAAEIAFIHEAGTDAKKKVLFDSVNAGRVRILFGSTEKMGAGTNVQRRLVALHHLDAPWRPRDIEQREGRILRQGNGHGEVEIHRYVTEGSFDAYMWQTLETKARFIQQVMNGSVTVRQAEDVEGGVLTFAEIKAIASGNPAVMEKVKVDTEVRKLDQLRASHVKQQHRIRFELSSLPRQIEGIGEKIEAVGEDIERRDRQEDIEFSMTVGNEAFGGKGARERAAVALNEVILADRYDPEARVRGTFLGFEIVSRGLRRRSLGMFEEERAPELFVRGRGTYKARLNAENPLGTIQSIERVLRGLEKVLADERERLAHTEKKLADFQEELGKPFAHEERLKELVRRQVELNEALDLNKGERQVEGPARGRDDGDDAESREIRAERPRAKKTTGPARVRVAGAEEPVASFVARRPGL